MTPAIKRKRLAAQITAYLAVRAEREGVEMLLTADWIEGGLMHGCRGFFGIEVNSTRILRDRQEPEPGFFDAWLRRSLN